MENKDPESREPQELGADPSGKPEERKSAQAKDEILAADEEIEDEILGTDADYSEPSPEADSGVANEASESSDVHVDAVETQLDSAEPVSAQMGHPPGQTTGEGSASPGTPASAITPDHPLGIEKPEPVAQNLNRILDIELPVTVHFGSVRRPLVEVLKLGPGSLLELDRLATEPVLLKVNDRIFARGQVVDVDGYYGVKITEIISTEERITSLGDY